MSGADDNWNFNPNQKYVTRFPDPKPSDHTNLGVSKKQNIDPVLSQAESDTLANLYNLLGRCGKIENIKNANLINDWDNWSSSIFSIGFNPKTLSLMKKCSPINFTLDKGEIKSSNTKIGYNSILPNDAGVIQKTFISGTSNPVFILAGLGTAGTSAAGFILSKYLIDIGKLYGGTPFCIFLKTEINEGRENASIDKVFPNPRFINILLHPFTYYKFRTRNFFLSKTTQ